MAQDPKTCKHGNVAVEANTNRVVLTSGEVGALILAVKATCADCGTKFWFPGLGSGQSYTEPTTSTDGFTLVTPMVEQNKRNQPDPSLTSFNIRNGDMSKGYSR